MLLFLFSESILSIAFKVRKIQRENKKKKLSKAIDENLLPQSTFLAPCALNFFRGGGKFFKYFFFLLSAHFNRLLYIEGNEFKA